MNTSPREITQGIIATGVTRPTPIRPGKPNNFQQPVDTRQPKRKSEGNENKLPNKSPNKTLRMKSKRSRRKKSIQKSPKRIVRKSRKQTTL